MGNLNENTLQEVCFAFDQKTIVKEGTIKVYTTINPNAFVPGKIDGYQLRGELLYENVRDTRGKY